MSLFSTYMGDYKATAGTQNNLKPVFQTKQRWVNNKKKKEVKQGWACSVLTWVTTKQQQVLKTIWSLYVKLNRDE